MAVSLFQQLQPTGKVREFFVVEVIDILEISIEGVEEFCMISSLVRRFALWRMKLE
jgi:hypothetical protein